MSSCTDPGQGAARATAPFVLGVAGATATPRTDPEESQDWWRLVRRCADAAGQRPAMGVDTPAHCAVVVCDGIGSLPDSRTAAAAAADAAARCLGEAGVAADPGFVVASAHERVQDLDGSDGGTTLVAAAADEHGRAAWIAVGNGAVVEVVAVPGAGGQRPRFVEHLLPQVDGSERLTGHLTHGHARPMPASGTLALPAGSPRLLVACSDGITSREHATWGTTADGRIWEPVDTPLAVVLEALVSVWDDLPGRPPGEVDALLERALSTALASLAADGALEDDATVAVIALVPAPPDTR